MSDDNNTQIEFWNGEAGLKWVREQEKMDLMLNPLSDFAIDLAQPKLDERVIDIGCGCGATSIELARRGAKVWGMDVSASMLSRARERAASYPESLFTEADASSFEFSSDQHLLFSRFGVMFFGNPIAAFENLRSAASNKAKLSFVCWQGPEKNPWITVPNRAAMTLVEMPPRAPDAPDPFSFADPEHVTQILHQAGWSGIDICPYRTEVAVGGRVGLREAALHAYEFGPVKAVAESTGQVPSEDVLRTIEDALAPYEIDGVVQLPGAAWIATAHNS